MCCLSGSRLWTGFLESVFAVAKASSPLAVSVTQLVGMSQVLLQFRAQNPDDITLIPARTRWYHLQLCDSAPWWKCLGWLTWRELNLR